MTGATAAMLPAGAAVALNGVEQTLAEFTGGATLLDGGVVLEVPEIADNGGAVPDLVAAEGAR